MDALSKRTQTAKIAAEKAGRFLMASARKLKPSDIQVKSKNNFVTWVDREAETLIRKIIRRAHPSDAVLGEESGQSGSGSVRWVIDPLDGTSNFIRKISFFGVSIGIEVDGRVDTAVIAVPPRKELFTAQRNHGAFFNGRRMRVSNRTALDTSLIGTAVPYKSLSRRWKTYETLLHAVARSGADTRRSGALAVDLAYTACGRMDALWAFDQAPWDVSAGSLLITEAGGIITRLWDASQPAVEGDIAAGNPALHRAVTRLARRAK